MRVAVVGAGIIGAWAAYHLKRKGADVTVFEAAQPASGASGNSFGWINATFSKRPRHYFDLSLAAIADWHRLEQELNGAIQVQWGGSVAWAAQESEAGELHAGAQNHREWGYPVQSIDVDQFRRLLPNIDPGEIVAAYWSETEGAVNAADVIAALLKDASVRSASPIENLDGLDFDAVVVAAGVGSAALANVPLQDSPGLLVHTRPLPRFMDRVAVAPDVHWKQGLDGRVTIGGQLVAGVGTAAAPMQDAEAILERARRYAYPLRGVDVEGVTVGYRVMPADEYPILGFIRPGVYVAAMHSGVTLAPLCGRLIAGEIVEGASSPELEPYRPQRFQTK